MLELFVATFLNVGGPLTPLTFSTIKISSFTTMVQNVKFLKLQHPTYNIMTCNKAPTTCNKTTTKEFKPLTRFRSLSNLPPNSNFFETFSSNS
jgi:hypothetical protein